MTEPIVTVSGVRGIVGESLTPEVALQFALAYGTMLSGGLVVLGRDTRPSGEMLKGAVMAGLLSTGCNIMDLGVVPTPTLQLAITHWSAAGGCQISASHNPPQWNALKFFDGSGMYLNKGQVDRLKEVVRSKNFCRRRWHETGKADTDTAAVERHIERILSHVDVERIRSRRFKVVVDCINGAACVITPNILERLGCEVTVLNGDATGFFAHNPEPTPENLTELYQSVREKKADVGFAKDPDVDRLAFVANTGEPLSEEMTLVIAVKHVLSRERGPVVTNLSTTIAIDEVAKQFGCEVLRTPVGDVNVSAKLKEVGGPIGGEGNGGVVFPKIQYARDAVAAMALVLDFMAQHEKPLSELVKELPRYHIVKEKLPSTGLTVEEIAEFIKCRYTAEEMVEEDGIKLLWKDHWVHVRPSGTEDIIRVIAEAETEEQARTLCKEVIRELEKLTGK